MAIPTGAIFIWTGTNASIPSGWERVTDLDDRFTKGNTDGSTNPNVTGGNSTHTHTGTSHTHTMASHTHTVSYGGASGTNEDSGSSDQNGVANGHGHPSQTSGSPTNVSVSSVSVTYTAVSNNPPYYEVIFIKPTTVASGLPQYTIGLYNDSDFVSSNTGKFNGYYECDGNNSTPDLRNKYLKGASSGGDAGGTGGSTTNNHTLTHTHSVSHDHAQLTTPLSAGPFNDNTGGSDMASRNHTHTTTINTDSLTTSDTPSTTTTETVEPAYRKLLALQNRSTSPYTPVGIIGMWLGTLTSVPSNFELVTSMYDKHLKISLDNTEIGNTGGSNTHTHASSSHTHASIGHSHTGSTSVFGVDTRHDGNGQGGVRNHNHSVSTSTENITLDSATTTADSSNNEPEYRTVAFIKYKGEKGGAFLFNFTR
jgi:hypothetical protein